MIKLDAPNNPPPNAPVLPVAPVEPVAGAFEDTPPNKPPEGAPPVAPPKRLFVGAAGALFEVVFPKSDPEGGAVDVLLPNRPLEGVVEVPDGLNAFRLENDERPPFRGSLIATNVVLVE